jgi:V/A-type H+/Na+-transporting ATPase subunit I
MSRVAIVATQARLRDALVVLADAGTVELVGPLPPPAGPAVDALRRLEQSRPGPAPSAFLRREVPDVTALEAIGARGALAGEVELVRRADAAIRHGSFAAWVGWTPTSTLRELEEQLAAVGAAVVELPRPAWSEPPTALQPLRLARPFRPLVDTYGATRYTDIDPTPFAAASFVLMFGMMFGDVGHGLVLSLLGLVLRRAHGRWAGMRSLWPLVVAAGLSGVLFGFLYGDAFGPTGLVPRLWLDPVDQPGRLLLAAGAVGAALLTVSYAVGTVNRWREAGAPAALIAPSGIAGFSVLLGGGLGLGGLYLGSGGVALAGAAVAAVGAVLLSVGFLAEAGRGPLAVPEAIVEVADSVIRIGANAISFTRLAAFGLMHAALGAVVFDATKSLWGGVVGGVLAAVVFIVGNTVTLALEGLVAGVQALRLEYYELFSRIFVGEGKTFAPWRIPVISAAGDAAASKEAA